MLSDACVNQAHPGSKGRSKDHSGEQRKGAPEKGKRKGTEIPAKQAKRPNVCQGAGMHWEHGPAAAEVAYEIWIQKQLIY